MTSKPATHRVYLRWPNQLTTDKTTTESEPVARFAFTELQKRRDLDGQDVAVAWSFQGRQVEFHEFKSAPGT